jgi:hypothetical protein
MCIKVTVCLSPPCKSEHLGLGILTSRFHGFSIYSYYGLPLADNTALETVSETSAKQPIYTRYHHSETGLFEGLTEIQICVEVFWIVTVCSDVIG